MSSDFSRQFANALRGWWREQSRQNGAVRTSAQLVREFCGFLRDSTPERRRQRYGDMEYDWEHRVNTTTGTVGWRERLLGIFHSPYQPTDPSLFHDLLASLPTDLSGFTFVDLGSGKGRTLLMASEYPFQKIVGVEILPELHRAAEENIRVYKSASQRCANLESICQDARHFEFPETPLLLYLFNPLPPAGLKQVLANLEESLRCNQRPVFVLYHNPLLEEILQQCPWLKPAGRVNESAIYANPSVETGLAPSLPTAALPSAKETQRAASEPKGAPTEHLK